MASSLFLLFLSKRQPIQHAILSMSKNHFQGPATFKVRIRIISCQFRKFRRFCGFPRNYIPEAALLWSPSFLNRHALAIPCVVIHRSTAAIGRSEQSSNGFVGKSTR